MSKGKQRKNKPVEVGAGDQPCPNCGKTINGRKETCKQCGQVVVKKMKSIRPSPF